MVYVLDCLENMIDTGVIKRKHWILLLDQSGKPKDGTPGTSMSMSVLNILMNSYPERMEKLFILDLSWFPKMILALVKPLLTKKTLAKFKTETRKPKKQGFEICPCLHDIIPAHMLEPEYESE